MKHLITLSLLSLSLYASLPQEIFPTALSSEVEIKFSKKATISENGKQLVTPELSGMIKPRCDRKFCEASETTPNALKELPFKVSSNDDTIKVDADITFNSKNIGHIVIEKDNLTITFNAPLVEHGFSPEQSIASIEDKAKNTTYIFKSGKYFINSFTVKAENKMSFKPSKKDSLKIVSEGNVVLLIDDKFTISKKSSFSMFKSSIDINSKKSSKDMLIYTKNSFDIETSGSYNINAFIYSFDTINISSMHKSRLKGAMHSKGTLKVGGSMMPSMMSAEFIYDKDMFDELFSFEGIVQSLPNDPGEAGKLTLEGIDANRNGLRDDVEILIMQYFAKYQPEERDSVIMAYMEDAKAYAPFILTDYDSSERSVNKERASVVSYKSQKATSCKWAIINLSYPVSNPDINKHKNDFRRYLTRKFESKIFNTEDRIKKYMHYNALRSGSVSAGMDYETLEACKDYPHIVEAFNKEVR
jgi:hypothetical protein